MENDLFANKLDVSALLERMGGQETGNDAPAALQPYEILADTARRARTTASRARPSRAGPSKDPDYGNSSGEVSIPVPCNPLCECFAAQAMGVFSWPSISVRVPKSRWEPRGEYFECVLA